MSRLAPWCAAILVAAAVLVGNVVVGDGRAEARGPKACTPYTAIFAPGTWETNANADPAVPVGMLRPIGDGLQQQFGSDITVLYAPYAASAFDQGLSYAQSLSTLEDRLHTMVSGLCASTRLILAGYSQGADGIGDVATEIGNGQGPISADRVMGVGLLADPHRDPNTTISLGNPQPGHGIAGTRGQDFGALTDRVRTLCVAGDLYCSLNATASPFLAALGRVLSGDPAPISALVPSAIDPATLVAQVVKMGAGWTATAANMPTILAGLTDLPTVIQLGDIGEAHQIASDLNDMLTPIVQAAAGVDLPLVASVIHAVAAVDPSGLAGAISVFADALTKIDILHIADVVGQMQETLWRAVGSLNTTGPIAATVDLSALVPSAMELAGSVVGPFANVVHGNLLTAAQALLKLGGPDSVNDLVQLSRQGVAMASFYASNAHVDYGDDAQILLNYLGSRVAS